MTRLSPIKQLIGLASWLFLSFAAAGVGAVASVSAVFLSTAFASRVERSVFTHGSRCLACMETAWSSSIRYRVLAIYRSTDG
jgi:hypothetical protein